MELSETRTIRQKKVKPIGPDDAIKFEKFLRADLDASLKSFDKWLRTVHPTVWRSDKWQRVIERIVR